MNPSYREHLVSYNQRPRFYEQYFDALYAYIIAHPLASLVELNLYFNQNIPDHHELNTGDLRMIKDARRLYAIQHHKVPEDLADVEMPHLEDGDTSELTWKHVDHNRMLVLSDIHFPYHDKYALMQALRYGKEKEVDSILLNGDILDFYQLSKFSKNPSKPNIRAELDIFRSFIDQLKQRFPDSTIYFKCGNHELRLEHWIRNNAAHFDGLIDLDHLVKFADHGIIYLKDNVGVKLGKLNIIHGHEIRASMGVVNIARTYYTKTQANILFGHWHQSQEYITRNLDGTITGAWTQGCLSKLDASYTYGINQWVHGFSVVDKLDAAGNFRVNLKKIIDGEVI